MKIGADKLASQLASKLSPVYLIAGDEHLVVLEAADAVRARAREQGYTDRECLFAGRGFDWTRLSEAGASLSLFASRRVLELRMPTGKPGREGARALAAYAQDPAPDTVLLIVSGKLDRSAASSAWVKALAKSGVFVQVWPIEARQLPQWIGARMRARGLEPDREAVSLLAERVEGNLLSAAQEIDKLLLLAGPGPVDSQTVRRAVADSARFDVFDLIDAALAADPPRALRILTGLRAEGTEAPLVLWALTRELRTLAAVRWQLDRGVARDVALNAVWARRKALVGRALGRLPAKRLHALLLCAARADRIAKGSLPGRVWDTLALLLTDFAGKPLRLAGG